MRRFISFLVAFCLLLSVCTASNGDPNVDGGGGSTGEGSSESTWSGGNDGVRVTVLRGSSPVMTMDFSNEYRTTVQLCFVPKCKLFYRDGGSLTIKSTDYQNYVPSVTMPRIISTNGSSTIPAIKSYFTDERVVRYVASIAGINYERLIGGDYKLLLEPISYFKYKGVNYAMTATEAALFDVKVEGQLKYWMGTLTHQNQPFSMFLERQDLGIIPWSGPTTGKQVNIDIINFLGVGIISFTPGEDIEVPEYADYVYRTDTDVITAVSLYNRTDKSYTPGQATARFYINGRSYSVSYVCPAKSTQLVWVRWHTPSIPQKIDIYVEGEDGASAYVSASIQDLDEKEPPDPGYYDVNPNFRLKSTPNWGSKMTTSWQEWVAEWVPGTMLSPGYYVFRRYTSKARLVVDYELVPDSRVRTATTSGRQYEMKSGYAVEARCEVEVITGDGVSSYDVTPVQNVVAVFPEFDFARHDRLLAPRHAETYNALWEFKPNKYSYYQNSVHFSPLWYPDRTEYPVPLAVFDAWTPGGMLYTTATDSIQIDGNLLDDWYIRTLTH